MMGDTIPPLHVEKECTKIYAEYFETRPIFSKKINRRSFSSESIDLHKLSVLWQRLKKLSNFISRYMEMYVQNEM